MRGRIILAVAVASFIAWRPAFAGEGKSAHCSHQRCACHQRHHPDHNWFHSAAPPRAVVASSIAAPQMFASPVLPVQSLRALNSQDKDLETDILRAIESLLDEKVQQTPADKGATASPSASPSTGSELDRFEQRLDALQKRVSDNEARLQRLLTAVEKILETSGK